MCEKIVISFGTKESEITLGAIHRWLTKCGARYDPESGIVYPGPGEGSFALECYERAGYLVMQRIGEFEFPDLVYFLVGSFFNDPRTTLILTSDDPTHDPDDDLLLTLESFKQWIEEEDEEG